MAQWPPFTFERAELWRIFDPRVDRSGGDDACWLWTGAKTKGGYGHIIHRRREFLTHRLALYFACVPLLRSDKALHSCDNPPCCNHRHLRAGTSKDNAQDRTVRKRRIYGLGEDCPAAKLTRSDVERIRYWVAAGWTRQEVAAAHGVSPSLVNQIVRRRIWAHVGVGSGAPQS